MKGYFYALLVASVCTSVCSMTVSGGFERYIKYIASLVCVAVMVSPFRKIDFSEIARQAEEEISVLESDNRLFYKTTGEMAEERTENYISEILFNKFGIKPLYSHIEIDWGKEEPVIEYIQVCLSSEDYCRNADVETYLCNVLGGEVEIIEG